MQWTEYVCEGGTGIQTMRYLPVRYKLKDSRISLLYYCVPSFGIRQDLPLFNRAENGQRVPVPKFAGYLTVHGGVLVLQIFSLRGGGAVEEEKNVKRVDNLSSSEIWRRPNVFDGVK